MPNKPQPDIALPHGNIASVGQLGALVRAFRRARGITQAEAAGLCGVGTRFFSELERGKATVQFGHVLQVLRGLGLEVWLLRRGTVPRAVPRDAVVEGLDIVGGTEV